jgi:hypothetical protein
MELSALKAYLLDSRSPLSPPARDTKGSSTPSARLRSWFTGLDTKLHTPSAAYLFVVVLEWVGVVVGLWWGFFGIS